DRRFGGQERSCRLRVYAGVRANAAPERYLVHRGPERHPARVRMRARNRRCWRFVETLFFRVKSGGSMSVQGRCGMWLGLPSITGLIRRRILRAGAAAPGAGEPVMKFINSTAIALVASLVAAPAAAQMGYTPQASPPQQTA